MTKQTSLFKSLDKQSKKEFRSQTTYGGSTVKGHRKRPRPFARQKWNHIVFKSDLKRHGLSFLSSNNRIELTRLIKAKAERYGLELSEAVIMKDHIHIKARSSSRYAFQCFLRVLSGSMARLMTKSRRGKRFGRFWRELVFTRVLKSAKEVVVLKGYFEANRIERESGYEARIEYLSTHRDWVAQMTFAYPNSG